MFLTSGRQRGDNGGQGTEGDRGDQSETKGDRGGQQGTETLREQTGTMVPSGVCGGSMGLDGAMIVTLHSIL